MFSTKLNHTMFGFSLSARSFENTFLSSKNGGKEWGVGPPPWPQFRAGGLGISPPPFSWSLFWFPLKPWEGVSGKRGDTLREALVGVVYHLLVNMTECHLLAASQEVGARLLLWLHLYVTPIPPNTTDTHPTGITVKSKEKPLPLLPFSCPRLGDRKEWSLRGVRIFEQKRGTDAQRTKKETPFKS